MELGWAVGSSAVSVSTTVVDEWIDRFIRGQDKKQHKLSGAIYHDLLTVVNMGFADRMDDSSRLNKD